MSAYSTRFRQSAQSARASQTRKIVNQNVTTSEAQVNQARAAEDQRRAAGKPPARKP